MRLLMIGFLFPPGLRAVDSSTLEGCVDGVCRLVLLVVGYVYRLVLLLLV
jgi:hypothetical protein